MKTLLLNLALLTVLTFPSLARAQDCDCSQTAGMCSATFKVKNITGGNSGPSHAADVELRSSQPRCSKISFFVDNTPYLSVLNNSNTVTENIFGTSPINDKTVSIDYCRICALKNAAAETQPDGNPLTQRFNAAGQTNFDKVAEANAASARASGQLDGPRGDGMLEVLNALGAMQGVLQQINTRNTVRSSGAAVDLAGRSRTGSQSTSTAKAAPTSQNMPAGQQPRNPPQQWCCR